MSVGRPKHEGRPRKYILPDDVHEWILQHGGGQYLKDIVRAIRAASEISESN